jgi:hypothetical protein
MCTIIGRPVNKKINLDYLLLAGCFLVISYEPEDEGNIFLRNVNELVPGYTASVPENNYRSENLKSASSSFGESIFQSTWSIGSCLEVSDPIS